MEIPDLLTVKEARKPLRCSDKTVRKLIKSGHLGEQRIENHIFIRATDIDAYLQRMYTPAVADA